MIVDGVTVHAPDDVTYPEIEQIVAEEKKLWTERGKELAAVFLKVVGDEIEVKSVERSPIKRLARITGYLSDVDKFNDAKIAELKDRKVHL